MTLPLPLPMHSHARWESARLCRSRGYGFRAFYDDLLYHMMSCLSLLGSYVEHLMQLLLEPILDVARYGSLDGGKLMELVLMPSQNVTELHY